MLKGISSLLSPDLLKVLHEMGHGDELVLADAHFPGHRLGRRVLRADGISGPALLDAIAALLVIEATAMMQTDRPQELDPVLEEAFVSAMARHAADAPQPTRVERGLFYERAGNAFCVVITGELRPYGNFIVRKGVTT